MSKLSDLFESCGCEDSADFLEQYAMEDCVPCICMRPECDNTAELEPDQDAGWCDHCAAQTMKSGLILLGVI